MEKRGSEKKKHGEKKIATTDSNFFSGRYARSTHETGPEEKLPQIRDDVDQPKSFLDEPPNVTLGCCQSKGRTGHGW